MGKIECSQLLSNILLSADGVCTIDTAWEYLEYYTAQTDGCYYSSRFINKSMNSKIGC